MLTSNKTSIVRNWKSHFEKTKSPIFAEKVSLITGGEPDWHMDGRDHGNEPLYYGVDFAKCDHSDELVGIEDKTIF